LLLVDAELLAPVPRPGKIVAVGRNYADHAKETGVAPFELPRIIAKLPSSVCGPGARIRRPAGLTKLDFEIELAVVIGTCAPRAARTRIAVRGRLHHPRPVGTRVQFDVSPAQTTFAKSLDGFCRWAVAGHGRRDCGPTVLELDCRVNGR
jgi:2-keto-4-pentenoate hydratase/2-oxohepta-3-ene-1,7-dioic acid hydratase in catechol pathway